MSEDTLVGFFDQKHTKYGYDVKEMFLMVIITGLTNFSIIPALIGLYRQRLMLQFHIGIFTLTCSFMYHVIDSVNINTIVIGVMEWHRLDNVGSIVCFIILLSYLSDLQDDRLEQILIYFGFLNAIICQEIEPWDIFYTLFPIFVQIIIYATIIIYRRRLPSYKNENVFKGCIILIGAVYCFYVGLDDERDYLRIHHGLWHMNIGIFSFYIWQAKLSRESTYSWKTVWKLQNMKKQIVM